MFAASRETIKLCHAALASLLVLALLPPCSAMASGPGQELRDFVSHANTILIAGEDRDLEDVVGELVALARPMVAFREAAESALGGDWQARTPQERDEFTRVFAALLERALVLRLAGAARIGRGVDMSFGDESITGDLASVRATAIGKDGSEIPLAYRFIKRGAGWAVRDVAIDGVSVIDNYRAQFSRIIREGSYPTLVERLRDKTGNGLVSFASAENLVASAPGPVALAIPPASVPPLPGPVALAIPPASVPPILSETVEAPGDRDDPATNGEIGEMPEVVEDTSSASQLSIPASPTKPTPRPRLSAPRYWVQVGAFKDVETATQLASRLLGDYWSVGLVPGQSLTRVRVGPFADRAQAVSTLRALSLRGFRPFVHEDPAL